MFEIFKIKSDSHRHIFVQRWRSLHVQSKSPSLKLRPAPTRPPSPPPHPLTPTLYYLFKSIIAQLRPERARRSTCTHSVLSLSHAHPNHAQWPGFRCPDRAKKKEPTKKKIQMRLHYHEEPMNQLPSAELRLRHLPEQPLFVMVLCRNSSRGLPYVGSVDVTSGPLKEPSRGFRGCDTETHLSQNDTNTVKYYR